MASQKKALLHKKTVEIPISTYHEYINEGIYVLRKALAYKIDANIHKEQAPFDSELKFVSDVLSSYAFLMFSNSLEAAANALLLNLKLSDENYKDLEKLSTISKIYLYCDLKGYKIDKGNKFNSDIKEIINCRNEFVHPKPKLVNVKNTVHTQTFQTKKTKSKGYPLYYSEIQFEHVVEALKDILGFLSWILFDVCKYKLEEGALIIGFDTYGFTADIDFIAHHTGIRFDVRTFGRPKLFKSIKII